MKFRTEIDVPAFGQKIDHSQHGFSIGSCFAESIAGKLRQYKFPLAGNPFGVLYNPFSIAGALESLAEGRMWTEDDLSENGGLWFSWDHHGRFSAATSVGALAEINKAASEGAEALAKAGYIVITFGTAWVFELDGRVVANCHKQPAQVFTRRRLTVDEIVSRFSALMEGPLKGKQVIFTVSPVRHLKDGFEENSLSKAVLRCAVGELVEKYPGAHYFPAYEILNDDLRDYRFYADDLVHPSDAAVEYIWEKFSGAAFGEKTLALLPQIENAVRAAAHRPFNIDTKAHAAFRRTMLGQIRQLQAAHPEIDFTSEMEFFGGGL